MEQCCKTEADGSPAPTQHNFAQLRQEECCLFLGPSLGLQRFDVSTLLEKHSNYLQSL